MSEAVRTRPCAPGRSRCARFGNDLHGPAFATGRFARLAASLLAVGVGSVGLSQAVDAHEVAIGIPEAAGIRIVAEDGRAALGAEVVFDYEGDLDAYAQGITSGVPLEPTEVRDFVDVQVSVQKGPWAVHTRSEPLVYTGNGTGAGLLLEDIRVVPGAASGFDPGPLPTFLRDEWGLSTAETVVAASAGATKGWRSLGFNGLDYRLVVHGDEDAGGYATVVTYTLLNP